MRHYKTIKGIGLIMPGLRIWGRIGVLAAQQQGWKSTSNLLKELKRRRDAVEGEFPLIKIKKLGRRLFFNYTTPAFPSKAFDRYHHAEIQRIVQPGSKGLSIAIVAITKKCPLNCEHCFEGEVLNQRESVEEGKFLKIIDKLISEGVSVIQFSGGEPMNRFGLLVKLIRRARNHCDTWVYTSGYGLTEAKAKELFRAGLTGVSVSLEHYRPEEHNAFRRNEKAFMWAEKAIKNVRSQGLATCLSVCAVKRFADREFMDGILELSRRWKIIYLQLLEPRAVGNYADEDVALAPEQLNLLEEYYEKVNFNKKYLDYPIIKYHGYYQRRIGCFGGGSRSVYIDTDGYVEACPFCREHNRVDYLTGELKLECAKYEVAGF